MVGMARMVMVLRLVMVMPGMVFVVGMARVVMILRLLMVMPGVVFMVSMTRVVVVLVTGMVVVVGMACFPVLIRGHN